MPANTGVTTFLACNALTNEIIAEIPYATGHYARVLNDNGVLEATVALDAPGIAFAEVAVPGTIESAYIAAVIADAPLGFWRLNETAGLVAHDEMGLHDGTYNRDVSAPTFGTIPGPVDATAIYLPVPYYMSGPAPAEQSVRITGFNPAIYTMECWAHIPSGGTGFDEVIMGNNTHDWGGQSGQFIAMKGGAYNASGYYANSGSYQELAEMTTSLPPGWHYIVVTADATHLPLMYIDGTLWSTSAPGSGPGVIVPGTCDFVIGMNGVSPSTQRPFAGGAMAEVAVYGYALTAGQVAAHYAARSGFLVTATREQTGGLVADGAVEPCAVSIYALRDGTIEWGGLLWGHTYDITTGVLSLTAAEFGSYLAYRYLTSDALYTGDISTLAADWVAAVCADGGPPMSIALTPAATTAALQTFAYEQHQVLDLIKTYATMSGGFDYAFDTKLDDNGNPSALLTISWPRRGRTATVSDVVVDVPGMATAMTLQKDGTRFATEVLVTGAGSGVDQVSAVVARPRAGYLKLQAVVNDPDITTVPQAALTGEGWLDALNSGPPRLPVLTMDGADFFALGVTIGDELTLALDLPYFRGSVPIRLLAYDVTPQNGSAPELVTLTLGAPL